MSSAAYTDMMRKAAKMIYSYNVDDLKIVVQDDAPNYYAVKTVRLPGVQECWKVTKWPVSAVMSVYRIWYTLFDRNTEHYAQGFIKHAVYEDADSAQAMARKCAEKDITPFDNHKTV